MALYAQEKLRVLCQYKKDDDSIYELQAKTRCATFSPKIGQGRLSIYECIKCKQTLCLQHAHFVYNSCFNYA